MSNPEEKLPETPDNTAALTDDNAPKDTPFGEGPQLSLVGVVEAHSTAYAGFDPSIHAVNEDGTPKRKASGEYALKRGRKAGGKSTLPPKAKDQGPDPEIIRINVDEAARQSANLVINAAVWTMGEEIGKPLDKAEAEGLKLSFKNYYEARGVPNIPPEIGLILALGSYIVPRIRQSEPAMTKMQKAAFWIKSKMGG